MENKNIFIVPTDLPSRLYKGKNGLFASGMLQTSIQSKNSDFINQNIYITSDEEIKELCWVICIDGTVYKLRDIEEKLDSDRKIVLTTDNELIDDGIQNINSDFIEWFVRNSNCEYTKVETHQYKGQHDLEYILKIPGVRITENYNPIKELIESYERKVETLRSMMENFKKPNNTSVNPDYTRLQTKMNCYRHFINELSSERMKGTANKFSEMDLMTAFQLGSTYHAPNPKSINQYEIVEYLNSLK